MTLPDRRHAFSEALGRLLAAAVWREIAPQQSEPPQSEERPREEEAVRTVCSRPNATDVDEPLLECDRRAG